MIGLSALCSFLDTHEVLAADTSCGVLLHTLIVICLAPGIVLIYICVKLAGLNATAD